MTATSAAFAELPGHYPDLTINGRHPMLGSYPPALRRQLLSRHFLISTMPERALDDLVRFSTVARYENNQDIVRKGEPGDCLYGILSGRVRIYSTSPEGGEITLNVQEEG